MIPLLLCWESQAESVDERAERGKAALLISLGEKLEEQRCQHRKKEVAGYG